MKTFASKQKRPAPIVSKAHQYVHHPIHSIQQIQRAKIRRILRASGAQAKLSIGLPNDRYEQDTDRVADRVMSMPDPQLQRQPEQDEEEETLQTKPLSDKITPLVQRQEEPTEEEDEELQRKAKPGETQAVAPKVESRINSLKDGGGRSLDPTIRSFFEPRIGHDFSHVRVHADSNASELARSVNARAFTLNNNIVMGTGEYRPKSDTGRRLLAHELTHVVQQDGRTGNMQGKPSSAGKTNHLQTVPWQSISAQPFIQRDLAIRPPRPRAVARTLSAVKVMEAITYNTKYLSNIPNSTAVISMIRDVLGISATPSVVDADLVRAVLDWQAINRLTQDGKLGPSSARRLFRELGAEKEGQGKIKSGPRYSPQVPIVRPLGGGREGTRFRFNAEFESDPAKGIFPSCCEVRQYIRWNAAAVASWGGPTVPHTGFPAAHPANRWIEDRDSTGTRYGHRSGRLSAPASIDQYLDSSNQRNQAYGHIYRGIDRPSGPVTDAGQYRFLVKVIDVCRGGRNIGSMDVIRVNW